MKFLFLNTCGGEGEVALSNTASNSVVRSITLPGRSASEMLVGAVREALALEGWRASDLDALGVVTGPGSFTGVRVGLSAAKGLSEATGAPIVGISHLELLASGAWDGASAGTGTASSTVCALLDAGRGEFYCGSYRGGECLRESLLSHEEAVEAARQADTVIVSEATVETVLAGRVPMLQLRRPVAVDALGLVARHDREGGFEDAATLDANYLRRTDAELFSSASSRSAL